MRSGGASIVLFSCSLAAFETAIYALDSSHKQRRLSGKRPIREQIVVAVATPVVGFENDTSWQSMPTSRRIEKLMSRTHPELLENPWRNASKKASDRPGAYTMT
jgi:hypothetical protein